MAIRITSYNVCYTKLLRPAVLLDKIEKNLEKNKKIVLDFSGLESITHEFLEGTLGSLLENRNNFV